MEHTAPLSLHMVCVCVSVCEWGEREKCMLCVRCCIHAHVECMSDNSCADDGTGSTVKGSINELFAVSWSLTHTYTHTHIADTAWWASFSLSSLHIAGTNFEPEKLGKFLSPSSCHHSLPSSRQRYSKTTVFLIFVFILLYFLVVTVVGDCVVGVCLSHVLG